MTAHSVNTIVIDRPAAVVFDTIHDYPNRLAWDTLLRKAYTLDNAPPAAGVVAVCKARWHLGGLTFATRYVTFMRPTLAAVALVKPYFIFEVWSASIRQSDLPSGMNCSDLTYTLTFRCRPSWLAQPLESIAQRLFDAETKRRLLALKKYLESN